MREPGAAKSFARWRCQELPGRSAARGAGGQGGRLQRGAAQGASLRGRGEEARSRARDPGLCWGLRAQSSPAPPGGAPWLCSHLGVSLFPTGAPSALHALLACREANEGPFLLPAAERSDSLHSADRGTPQLAAPHPAPRRRSPPSPPASSSSNASSEGASCTPPRPWLPTGRCQTWERGALPARRPGTCDGTHVANSAACPGLWQRSLPHPHPSCGICPKGLPGQERWGPGRGANAPGGLL